MTATREEIEAELADRRKRDPALQQIALNDVLHERGRQDAKWGPQNHDPLEWLSILLEEVGEVAMAANQAHWAKTRDSAVIRWDDYRAELIQVAAVAVAAVESFDRNRPPA